MKKAVILIIFLLVFCGMNTYLYCAELPSPGMKAEIKTLDVNKDGKPEVTYYSDGKYVTKVEADTNSDGKPDITEHIKDGKFESAEVDTNGDGKIEKKFNKASEFNKWLNQNHPDYNDKLNKADWTLDTIKF